MSAYKMQSTTPYTISNIEINSGEIWSGYHKDYTPLTNNPKNIIFKINETKDTVTIIVNSLYNFFSNVLPLENMYLVYKF